MVSSIRVFWSDNLRYISDFTVAFVSKLRKNNKLLYLRRSVALVVVRVKERKTRDTDGRLLILMRKFQPGVRSVSRAAHDWSFETRDQSKDILNCIFCSANPSGIDQDFIIRVLTFHVNFYFDLNTKCKRHHKTIEPIHVILLVFYVLESEQHSSATCFEFYPLSTPCINTKKKPQGPAAPPKAYLLVQPPDLRHPR